MAAEDAATALPRRIGALEGKTVTIEGATGRVGVEVPVLDSSKDPAVTMLADKAAIRDVLRMELSLDQFIGSTAGLRCWCRASGLPGEALVKGQASGHRRGLA
jgi:hypothetical protein